jgi:hypothetical protein
MENNMEMNNMFMVGDRISYKDELGTVTRTSILGFKPCCAIQIKWDKETIETNILKMRELNDCVKQ